MPPQVIAHPTTAGWYQLVFTPNGSVVNEYFYFKTDPSDNTAGPWSNTVVAGAEGQRPEATFTGGKSDITIEIYDNGTNFATMIQQAYSSRVKGDLAQDVLSTFTASKVSGTGGPANLYSVRGVITKMVYHPSNKTPHWATLTVKVVTAVPTVTP